MEERLEIRASGIFTHVTTQRQFPDSLSGRVITDEGPLVPTELKAE